jgi:tetratricopeptide (TPR) repeat protein
LFFEAETERAFIKPRSEIYNFLGVFTISLGFVEYFYGSFFWIKGNWKSAIEHLQDGIKYLEEVKWLWGLAMARSVLGSAYSFLGDPEIGKRHAEEGLRIHRDSGIELFLSMYQGLLGMIHLHLSDLKNARSFMEEALRLSKKNNEKFVEGQSWIWLGKILGRTELPQIDKSEECILKGMEIFHELQLKPYYFLGHLFLGELYLDAVEKEMAVKNLKKAEEMFQEMGMDYWLRNTRDILKRL